jgi:GDP-L-fucose synthase
MPTNIYGPRDNFDIHSSHVLPALIRKFYEAKNTNADSIELWGTGRPLREFLHSRDLASAIEFTIQNYNDRMPLNVGTGREISILELAVLIAEVVGFKGEIRWDHSKPDGTPRKLLDSAKLKNLGWESSISLEDGISETYEWFLDNVGKGKVRL